PRGRGRSRDDPEGGVLFRRRTRPGRLAPPARPPGGPARRLSARRLCRPDRRRPPQAPPRAQSDADRSVRLASGPANSSWISFGPKGQIPSTRAQTRKTPIPPATQARERTIIFSPEEK